MKAYGSKGGKAMCIPYLGTLHCSVTNFILATLHPRERHPNSLLSIFHALVWANNTPLAGHVCPSVCLHELTSLLEPTGRQQWDQNIPPTDQTYCCKTMEPWITSQHKHLWSMLEDIVAEQLHFITSGEPDQVSYYQFFILKGFWLCPSSIKN